MNTTLKELQDWVEPLKADGLVRPAELIEQLVAEQPQEPMTRYCPECGHIGDVPSTARDCCPDGMHARVVPLAFAQKCKETFDCAIASNVAGGFAKLFWRDDVGQVLVVAQVDDPAIDFIFELKDVGRAKVSMGFTDVADMEKIFAVVDDLTAFSLAKRTSPESVLQLVDEIGRDDDGQDDNTRCDHCNGDGMDPDCDRLLPCPACQGEQRP